MTTAKERILAKPELVQQVLKCWITKKSIENGYRLTDDQMEHFSELALEWWNLILYTPSANPFSESEIGAMVFSELNKQDQWGRIFGGAGV